jgi:hypothetical protein
MDEAERENLTTAISNNVHFVSSKGGNDIEGMEHSLQTCEQETSEFCVNLKLKMDEAEREFNNSYFKQCSFRVIKKCVCVCWGGDDRRDRTCFTNL